MTLFSGVLGQLVCTYIVTVVCAFYTIMEIRFVFFCTVLSNFIVCIYNYMI